MKAKTKAFLRALEALCRQHGVTITGCGCCDSPNVVVDGEDVGDVNVEIGNVYIRKGDDLEDVDFDKPTLLVDKVPL